ncbi:hypothetical protein Ahy_B01g056579 [Arachis hypogaea]|uniref:Uncharacterized protein n=1 Tax=Arachis hypogaea TaxID=3818 RepID=A0A445AZ35_ARAHY|nr:hypothetical protein Ahy_B01g056579 [Arachis hypogaea]
MDLTENQNTQRNKIVTKICNRCQFSKVRTQELLAKLGDVIANSGGLNWNHQSVALLGVSSLMPVVVSTYVAVVAPEAMLVASPFFVVDLN